MSEAPMSPETLMEILRPVQEKQGYHFNVETGTALEILKQGLNNKARYGYMSCPCRLASGSFERDKDMLCPCTYRVDDVREYGSCFCGLYVSKEWNEGLVPHGYVPDRRPGFKVV